MQSATYQRKDTHVLRLTTGEDLLGQITDYCNDHEIDAAEVTAIGAVENATLGFYDQDSHEYDEHTADKPMELLQASGNVSYLDGERFVHLHGTFSDEAGEIVAGHIFEGTDVFAGEAVIHELDGPELIREFDPETGLSLWDLPSS